MLKLKLQYFDHLYKELTHLKRPWGWERLKAGGEEDDRGWDGWMASLTQWTWVWVNSGSWRWTGRPGVLQSTEWQRVGHNWSDWTMLNYQTRRRSWPAEHEARAVSLVSLWSLCSPRRVLSPHDHTHVGDKAGAHERWGTRNNVLAQNQDSRSATDKEKWKPVKRAQQSWEEKKEKMSLPSVEEQCISLETSTRN